MGVEYVVPDKPRTLTEMRKGHTIQTVAENWWARLPNLSLCSLAQTCDLGYIHESLSLIWLVGHDVGKG